MSDFKITPKRDKLVDYSPETHVDLVPAEEQVKALLMSLEEARRARDEAEAKCRWIERVKPSASADHIAMNLPPDVLMHPMPYPSRVDYAAKMIQHGFEQWSEQREKLLTDLTNLARWGRRVGRSWNLSRSGRDIEEFHAACKKLVGEEA